MSNRKLLNARLEGYAGPFFPPAGKYIQRRYIPKAFKAHPLTYDFLLLIPLELSVFGIEVLVRPDPVTSDGTVWMAELKIRFPISSTEARRFIILFPKAEDSELHDGTLANARVALYAEGIDHPSEQEREQVMQTLLHAIHFAEQAHRFLFR